MTEYDAVIAASIACVVGFVWFLDYRRRRYARMRIIKIDLGRLAEIIEYVTFHASRIEEDGDDAASKLSRHMARHRDDMKSLILDIQIQRALCDWVKIEADEKITDALKSARWILDHYSRDDIPEPNRERVWYEPTEKLFTHARKIIRARDGI